VAQRFSTLPPEAAAKITKRIAQASIALAIVLIILKAGAWWISGSVAMLSSLADSALDLAASVFTALAVAYAATPPDREHRFGHGKAEAFAGLIQAGLVLVSAALIAWESIRRLINPVPLDYSFVAIGVMMIATMATSALIWAQSRALAQTGSVATAGDRAHYASDLAANIAVMTGIGASTFLGWRWADGAAGLAVALWLIYGAWEVFRVASDHLMDHEMPGEDRERIRELAMADGAIHGVHDLRTRMSGPYVHVQFHAELPPDLSLEEAHRIVVAAEDRIRAAYPAADLIIHPDPDDVEPHGHEYFSEGRQASS
jgi:cation diffusion facilitator family transporter